MVNKLKHHVPISLWNQWWSWFRACSELILSRIPVLQFLLHVSMQRWRHCWLLWEKVMQTIVFTELRYYIFDNRAFASFKTTTLWQKKIASHDTAFNLSVICQKHNQEYLVKKT